ncbi:putative glucose-methanol-choline oxidoreductase protein [Botrytis fragariae]|uniref:Putative glucose-methanol-choline oxidoreductase protein n=1 Tax=Botrytis fragariae TaxID=1964551 RepID=A0A8H6B1A5_9HELO|nr:putative glucose-methanol-choline oxidoreductase protein [Botrytis fragariae]KAF5877571.1 putative glucose-methanol-choline oxidoreductase protein [Botrytis fragariae]
MSIASTDLSKNSAWLKTQSPLTFIIIRGGTSGLAVANRLSEDPTVKVLVLESGKNYLGDPRSNMLAGWPALFGTEADWNFVTTPQESLDGKVMGISQGQTLGGFSAINSSVFMIPSQDWKILAPYFRKFHTLTTPLEAMECLGLQNNHSANIPSSGPIQASFPVAPKFEFPKLWNETFKNLGYGFSGDVSDGTAFGPYSNPASVDPNSGQRSYTARAYYEPQSGLSFLMRETIKTLRAFKGVILAFSISIGYLCCIENPNIKENLKDHIISGISFGVNDGVGTIDILPKETPKALSKAMTEYMTSQSGPFGRAAVMSTSFVPVDDFQTKEDRDELENLLKAYPSPASDLHHHKFVRSLLRGSEQGNGIIFMYAAQGNLGAYFPKGLIVADMPENFVTISALLLNPLSIGYVHISSVNHVDASEIDFNYLSNPLDLEVLARHLRFVDKLAKTEPHYSLLKPNAKRNKLYTRSNDLDEVKKYVKKTGMSDWHLVGTCSMLPENKGGGGGNLRVLDASIMPIVPRSNTQTVVYAVAERAADIIKGTSWSEHL